MYASRLIASIKGSLRLRLSIVSTPSAVLPEQKPLPNAAALIKPATLSWRSVFRWSFYIVGLAPVWIAVETLLTVGLTLLTMYNFVVLGTVISALQNGGRCEGGRCGGDALAMGWIPLPRTGQSAAIVFATLTVLLILGGYANRTLGAWLTNLLLGRFRQEIHDRLLTLGPAFQDRFNASRSLMLITSYASVAQMMLRELVTAPIIKGVSLVGALFFLATLLSSLQAQDLSIHVALLVGLIGLPIVGWFLAARLRVVFAKALGSQVQLTDEFLNSTSKPDEVQLMGAEPQRSRAFAARVQSLVHDQFVAESGRELANAFQNAIPSLLQVVLLMYGIFVALGSGSWVAAGAIVALYQIVPQAISPIQELLQIAAAFTASWPQVEAVIEVLETEPEGGKSSGTLEIGPDDRTVTFENVTFSYAPDRPKIVDGLNHTFAVGQVTAVVARFGVGKSTILNLIARLRRPQGGTIRIGDKDLVEIRRASLRSNVVKVSQFPLLISDSARENFRLAKADASDAEIEAVCRTTGFWEVLVKETPPGGHPLDYAVSRQDGTGLSGGQRRMLAVTRALLLRPTVLLLDEPTTGIDPIGRYELYETLAKACAGLTVIVVDQDVNFLANFAHQICCLENARFGDIGSPAELLSRPSLFAKLTEAANQ